MTSFQDAPDEAIKLTKQKKFVLEGGYLLDLKLCPTVKNTHKI